MSAPVAESGSGQVTQKIPTMHHPEGIEPDRIFFQETQVRNLILDYQREGTRKPGKRS
jgi:hypothetical protein